MVMLRRKLLRDLVHMRAQAAAVALIVAAAVATYVTMRGAYESLLVSQRDYYASCRFAQIFCSLKRAPDSLVARLRAIDGVAIVDTRVVRGVTLDVPNLPEPASGMLLSVPDRGEALLNRTYLRRGRAAERQDDVVVSEAFADANQLAPGDTLNAVINGRWRRLHICGVAIAPEYITETRGGAAFPDNRRFGVLWMKRDEVAGASGMRGAFNDVAMTLSPGASEPDVVASVDRLLAPYGGLGAYGRNEQPSHRFIRDELAQDRVTALVIPGIFLAVAALLIHLLLMRLVTSQREQIAVLKAFGYGHAAVARHYAGFGVVIVTAGAIAGIPVGLWLGRGLTELYTRFFHFPALHFRVSAFSIVLSVGITLLAALGGSLLAVRNVVSLPPAEGMRGETPVRYGVTLLDRLRVFHLVSPPVRMIFRSLQRTPLRTLLSLLAMSTAAMILVVGQYSFDALDFMIETQFRRAQTDDATVEFTEVRGERAARSLAAMPGVTRVEPIRNVPVRLRSGHRTRRVVLTGLEPGAQLRRLVGMHGEVTELPPTGLVMATRLAEILELRAGDVVSVEALEGLRPVATMQVTALADEMVGTSVYASRADVNRFLREGPSLTAASLAVEPSQAAALYARLKKTPAVAAVALREAMLDSFRKTIAENMRISAMMIVIFAAIISVGVIYNGARIALSERGRDLASLRVLGFSRAEVGAMLLGEQAVLTLASIPIGFAGGYALCLWLVKLLDSEVYRLPMIISGRTYALSFLVIVVAALLTALLVQRRIGQLDLVAVLKTRE